MLIFIAYSEALRLFFFLYIYFCFGCRTNSSDKKGKLISTNSGWKYFLRRKELKSNWIFIGKEEEGVLKKKR